MSYASEVLADSPRAWYRMDDASGLIQDSSGNAQHANASEGAGSATYSEAGALASDTASKSIRYTPNWRFIVADSASLDIGDVFTIEMWLKINAVPTTDSDLLSKQDNAYELHLLSDRTIKLSKSGVSDTVTSTAAVPNDGSFHHLVAAKDGASSCKLYIDNVDVTGTVTDSTYADNALDLRIGGHAADFFDGWLDEVALYSTALSAARVDAHWDAAQGAVAGAPILHTLRSNRRW